MLKLGNTYFNKGNLKETSFTQFKKQYEGLLKGITLEEAYEKLTGKTVKKSSKDSE